MSIIKKHKELIVKFIFLALIAVAIILYFYSSIVSTIFNILIISYILSSILNPIMKRLSKNKRVNNKLIAIILVLLIVIIFFIIIFSVMPIMFKEINNCGDIIDEFKMYLENFENSKSYKEGVIVKYIYNTSKEKIIILIPRLSESIVNNVVSISNNLLSYAVIPVVTYYFLSDRDKLSKKFYKWFPVKKRGILKKMILDCNMLLGNYLLGQVFLSFIISIITLVILLVFKVKFPIILSIFNGITNIIPYFGPIFGALPIVLIAFLDSTNKGIIILVALVFIQQIEGNILSPKITGDSTNMHPLMIIILLLIGEQLGGFIGMILAVPIGVILKVIYEDINYYLF